jgi:nicotinamidase-related amidase
VLNRRDTAVIVIDMINDFVLTGAPLEVPGVKGIIAPLQGVLSAARDRDIPVIYVSDSHFPEDPEFTIWPPHAVCGTEGENIIDELTPEKGDFILKKRRYSCFFGTDLDALLRDLGVKRVILTGIVADICVLHTAADAYMNSYKVYVLRDCVKALSQHDLDSSFERMKKLYDAKIVASSELF